MIRLPDRAKAANMWRTWAEWAKQWRERADPDYKTNFHNYDHRLGRNSPISSIDIQDANRNRYDLDRR